MISKFAIIGILIGVIYTTKHKIMFIQRINKEHSNG